MSLVRSELLKQIPNLRHGFSNRINGYSEKPFDSLNLQYPGNHSPADHAKSVQRNRQKIADQLDLPLDNWVACQQVHQAYVHHVQTPDLGRGAYTQSDGIPNCDGLMTQLPGTGLLVMVADCYPVILVDPEQQALAVVHAGWRGVHQKIVSIAIQQLCTQYGSHAQDIRAAIGPGIGFDSFEVGAEVVTAFGKRLTEQRSHLVVTQGQKYRIDLPGLLRYELLDSGIHPEHIDIMGLDTFTNEQFFSYRRENGLTGRQGAIVGWAS